MLGIVVALLAASIAGNVYQGTKLACFAYRWKQGLMSYYDRWEPSYPVDGLSMSDLATMLEQVSKEDCKSQNKRILAVEMMDRNHVLIQTGIMVGGLAGGGLTFRFTRTADGWKLDERGSWVS